MNDLEKAIAHLISVKQAYPATFRAHRLDHVLDLLTRSAYVTDSLPLEWADTLEWEMS